MLKAIGIELGWLVGSYVVAFLIMRALITYPTLDIQMHNTYFVLSISAAAVPVFASLASVVTGVRLAVSQLQTPYTVVILKLLAGIWLLLIAIVLLLIMSIMRHHHSF